jgi:hypothetical protein
VRRLTKNKNANRYGDSAKVLNTITYLYSSMANRRGARPFVTINLKVSEEEYSKLKEQKDKDTWESYFLRLAGI